MAELPPVQKTSNLLKLSGLKTPTSENEDDYLAKLYEDTIGNNLKIKSPFLPENYLIYNDFTASGRALKSIEDFIIKNVLPSYANVHTTIGYCAEQTTNFMVQSKDILRDYCNSWGNYNLVFNGSGVTASIHKLIELLDLHAIVHFYEELEVLASSYDRFINDRRFTDPKQKTKNFENCNKEFIDKIRADFIKIFIKTNFCYKFKDKNGSCYKCLLCQEKFVNEGLYNSHEEKEEHQQKAMNYNSTNNKLFNKLGTDFIDLIRNNKKYQNSIYELLKDYKKFKPVVFLTLYEHNSNKLSWIEIGAQVVTISTAEELQEQLKKYKDHYIKIGSFTSCSNITGKLIDVDLFSIIMHMNNGLCFFDYASGGPYLKMDVQKCLPNDYRKLLGFRSLSEKYTFQEIEKYCFKDGLMFSPHKFLGGMNTPGVLIVHDRIGRTILRPTQPGGGTVNYVLKDAINYIKDVELKEESGTPNIIGSIRIGLTILVRNNLSHNFIAKRDSMLNKRFVESFNNTNNPKLFILGDEELHDKEHIPIFSFMVPYENTNKLFHPNFISALLNDLFGIQSRPGCSCSPYYGQYLLGVDKNEHFEELKKVVHDGMEIFKPGFTRLNLPFFYPLYVIDFIINAIKFVCKYAYLFINFYKYDINSGKFWHYQSEDTIIKNIKALFKDNNLEVIENDNETKDTMTKQKLDQIFNKINAYISSHKFIVDLKKAENYLKNNNSRNKLDKSQDDIRWFILFYDVNKDLNDYISKNKNNNNKIYKKSTVIKHTSSIGGSTASSHKSNNYLTNSELSYSDGKHLKNLEVTKTEANYNSKFYKSYTKFYDLAVPKLKIEKRDPNLEGLKKTSKDTEIYDTKSSALNSNLSSNQVRTSIHPFNDTSNTSNTVNFRDNLTESMYSLEETTESKKNYFFQNRLRNIKPMNSNEYYQTNNVSVNVNSEKSTTNLYHNYGSNNYANYNYNYSYKNNIEHIIKKYDHYSNNYNAYNYERYGYARFNSIEDYSSPAYTNRAVNSFSSDHYHDYRSNVTHDYKYGYNYY